MDGRFPGHRIADRREQWPRGGDRQPARTLDHVKALALQGREAEAAAAIASAIDHAAAGGQVFATYAHWAASVLYNGLGRYDEAAASARQATSHTFEYWVSIWALPELVEAAMRTGEADSAREALERLAETTQPSGTDLALGLEARSRAMLSHGDTSESLYREAVERLSRTRVRTEIARAHLLYGEWLRREGRRVDPRSSCGSPTRCASRSVWRRSPRGPDAS